ncbi:MAG: hypothetical protein QOG55_498, partial [Acidobacteriaceae bacterium]|nr:hypothetical protein [Acidobacteriaceae bacterium]
GIGGSGPGERAGLGIVGSDEVIDLSHQFFDAAKGAPTNGFLGDDVKPDFHLIQPGSIGGSEMHLHAGMRGQPALHAGMLVRGVVVHDEVDGQSLGNAGVDLFQKMEILLMAMAALAPTDHSAAGQIQSGEQRGGAMANVVVSYPFDVTQPHGQQGLSALQGLDLALFIDAQHHGFVRRMQIQPHDIPHFFNEEGIGGELKVTLPMRLQTKRAPNAMHCVLRQARLRRQRTATPVCGVGGLCPQRLANQRRDSFIADRARATRAQFPVQPLQTLLEKTPPPIAYGHSVEMKPGSNRLVAHSRSTQQNDPRPPYQTVREGARGCDGAQLLAFLRVQQQGRLGSSHRHRHLHCSIEGAHTEMSKARLMLVT